MCHSEQRKTSVYGLSLLKTIKVLALLMFSPEREQFERAHLESSVMFSDSRFSRDSL